MKNSNHKHANKLLGKLRKMFTLTATIGILLSASSFGAFIDNGNTIIDTATGFEWFKFNQTTGVSVNSMVANFSDSGSAFFGFRYATDTEIVDLWAEAGLAPGSGNNAADVTAFNTLFGTTAGANSNYLGGDNVTTTGR